MIATALVAVVTTTATTAAEAAAATAATTATAAEAATTAAGTWTSLFSLVDAKRTATHLKPLSVPQRLRRGRIVELDKRESFGASRIPVSDNSYRHDLAELGKECSHLFFRSRPRKVPNK